MDRHNNIFRVSARITCTYCLIFKGLDEYVSDKCPNCRAVSTTLAGSKYWAVRLT
jgi:phage FluMu protein Com